MPSLMWSRVLFTGGSKRCARAMAGERDVRIGDRRRDGIYHESRTHARLERHEANNAPSVQRGAHTALRNPVSILLFVGKLSYARTRVHRAKRWSSAIMPHVSLASPRKKKSGPPLRNLLHTPTASFAGGTLSCRKHRSTTQWPRPRATQR